MGMQTLSGTRDRSLRARPKVSHFSATFVGADRFPRQKCQSLLPLSLGLPRPVLLRRTAPRTPQLRPVVPARCSSGEPHLARRDSDQSRARSVLLRRTAPPRLERCPCREPQLERRRLSIGRPHQPHARCVPREAHLEAARGRVGAKRRAPLVSTAAVSRLLVATSSEAGMPPPKRLRSGRKLSRSGNPDLRRPTLARSHTWRIAANTPQGSV
jgi:hypothetical protein